MPARSAVEETSITRSSASASKLPPKRARSFSVCAAKAAALADPEMFLRPYRRALDTLLEERERETPGSLRLDAGRCLVCERCARRDEQPCRFPEKLRYSLESLGANVGALAADKLGAPLQWGTRNAAPEYFVLVGALLTKGE